MSIFAKVTPIEDDVKNAERYQHLCTYASIMLGEMDIEPLQEKAELSSGMTRAKLDHFQLLIESAAAMKEYREAKSKAFEVDSQESADWYLSKRLQFTAELEGVKAQYSALISQIQSKLTGLEFMFEEQTKAFTLAEYERTGVKTMILPHGTLAVRTTKPAWSIGDETALQDWLDKLGTGDKTFYEVYPKTWTRNLDRLKLNAEKHYEKDKQMLVPGLKRDDGGNKVYIRLPKEAAE